MIQRPLTLSSSIDYCRDSITKGSKSFSLASRLFDAETRDAAFCLYGWCRHCDDEIDQSESGFLRETPVGGLHRSLDETWERLRNQTRAAYANDAMTEPVFLAFQYVVKKYSIPQAYPMELLKGMEMDVRKQTYRTFDDLLLYCYRVAGVVGLMMAHIIGLSRESALKNACDMGIAMQLTNIARDIADDFRMGRIYVPEEWLQEERLPPDQWMEAMHADKRYRLVLKLLDKADAFYRSGDEGLSALPLSAVSAIASARRIYSDIGRVIIEQGARSSSRAIVSTPRKAWLAAVGISHVIPLGSARLFRRWKRVPLTALWNPYSGEK